MPLLVSDEDDCEFREDDMNAVAVVAVVDPLLCRDELLRFRRCALKLLLLMCCLVAESSDGGDATCT